MSDLLGKNYINCEKGLWSWLTTLDHKRIGIMYLIAIVFFAFLGAVFSLILRYELFSAGKDFLTALQYNKVMTYHGAIMTFMVLVPGIPAVLGNILLPLQIGAKDVAFPRLNLLSWYLLILGAAIAIISLFTTGVDTGWTFYAPYSTGSAQSGTIFVVLGAFVMGLASILTGLNFIATIHQLRAKGMTFMRMPLFVWGLYATSIIQIVATPVVGITLLLLVAERVLGVGVFDPKLGGDPILFQHFFWFYSHPVVYLMVLPGMGVISEVVTAFSKKVIFGYKAIVYASVAIAGVGFLVWGHHMFVSGQSDWAGVLFSFITMFVGIPTAVKIFNWMTTLYKGSIEFRTPLLFALGFLFVFAIGGLTGLFLATLSTDMHFHDTYFVVAHFHYTMVGGAVMAVFAGLFYWWPKICGRMYNELQGQIGFAFVFIGFNVTFFPQFILGAMGMPRRYFDYLPEFEHLHAVSTVGSTIVNTGMVILFVVLYRAWKYGEIAGDNPWNATTLEWQTTSPPPHENFTKEMKVTGGPYDYA